MRTLRLCVTAAVVLAAIASCKPWTIRPIEGGASSTASERFDATAYVDAIWTTRVLPEAKTSAIALGKGSSAVPAGGSAIFVRGAGVVQRVDTGSRIGLAHVDLAPADGRADVALQIGPVIRGTAARDALPFIRFGDFANQLAFADVANALNARVLGAVLAGVTASALERRTVAFWGAARVTDIQNSLTPEVVPVILEVEPK
jgi:predicted lipoprotein